MLGAEEIAFILDHSGAAAFVVEDALVPVAEQALAASTGTATTRAVVRLSDGATSPTAGSTCRTGSTTTATPTPVIVADDDPVRMMFTSGTESRPKGALLSSRSADVAVRLVRDRRADERRRHRAAHAAALPLRAARLLPRRRRLPRRDQHHPAGARPRRDPAGDRGARGHQVLRAADDLDRAAAAPGLRRADLSSLRKGYYGASPMPVAVLEEMRRRLPDVDLWNFYGQTEMSPLATILGPEEQLAYPGSAGRAALNVETRIVDDRDEPVPAGTVGEIVHRSPHATLGYYRDDEKTARGVPRRLVPLGRPRLPRRRRSALRRGPQEGHDQDRRRERREPRGRGGDLPARRGRRGRGLRRRPPALGGGGRRGRRTEGGRDA